MERRDAGGKLGRWQKGLRDRRHETDGRWEGGKVRAQGGEAEGRRER